MTKVKVASLHNHIELNLPYMFANPALIEKKVNINQLIEALSNGNDEISLNINFPIMITKQPASPTLKLVMRIRKFRHKTTGKIIARPEIIGVVKTKFGYEALADFHFSPKFPSEYLLPFLRNYHSSKGPDTQNNFLNQLPYRALSFSIQPGVFSKNQNNYILPNKYLFEDHETMMASIKDKKEIKLSFQAKFLHFLDKGNLPEPETIPDNIKDLENFLFVKEKFEERPVWLKNALMVACKDKVKFESFHKFKKMLSFLAYGFKDGPWKHAYVRFGYDPRSETGAVIYQVIDVGVPEMSILTENFAQSQRRNELETYDPTFTEAPTKVRQLYQLCDLKDQSVFDILEKEKAALERRDEIECDKKFGWLSKKSFKVILKYMKSKFKIG